MRIHQFEKKNLQDVIRIWNESVKAGEVVYFNLDELYFNKKFEQNPNYDPQYSLVAEEDGKVIGFINGVTKKICLDGEDRVSTPGFLTCVFVDRTYRRRGVGRVLVEALGEKFRENGKTIYACHSDNPINLDWHVPGTLGHDHNNAPGVDEDCEGYDFFRKMGFEVTAREIAMHLDLSKYVPWDGLKAKQKELLEQGIYTGRYNADWDWDYDRMMTRGGFDYWHSVLRTEIECHKQGKPCTDNRFIPNGKIPTAPRPMIVAGHKGYIVAFTGPVDKQLSGRGWFSGICTDPEYERKGIASVLFNLLMQEFVAEGATFSTLFTGDSNHAQKIYKRAGFNIARRWCIMKKAL